MQGKTIQGNNPLGSQITNFRYTNTVETTVKQTKRKICNHVKVMIFVSIISVTTCVAVLFIAFIITVWKRVTHLALRYAVAFI